MNKLIIFFALSIIPISLSAQSFLETNEKKLTKELEKNIEGYSGLEHIKNLDNREFYKIKTTSDEKSRILVLSDAHGRFEKFDLMTVVNSGKIELIKILKYRSEYGSEISNKKWLAQFYTQPDSIFLFRKNIDAISGATFSTQGLISEQNQILKVLENFNN